MLQNLYVKNLAVAAEVGVEFGPGLNVLTGETGAGKSILVDSLALLAGARATGELIRADADELTVSGTFTNVSAEALSVLDSAGVSSLESDLVVRRVVSRAGRNRVFLNDEPVTLKLLTTVSQHFIRIHTQREELGLVSPETQRRWLDRSGGAAGQGLASDLAEVYQSYRELTARLERVTGNDRLRLERLDLLRFQSAEIDGATLEAGEEDDLRLERRRLRHGEAIAEAIGGALDRLVDGDASATDRLAQSERALAEIAEWEPSADEWRTELTELRARLEDLVSGMRGSLGGVESDPARLDAIEERLTLVERLLRKYGNSTIEILAQRERMRSELDELQASDERCEALTGEVEESLGRYRAAATELSRARKGWSEDLATGVHRELADLAMGRARFAARLSRRRREGSPLVVEGQPVEFSAAGFDEVVFELAANPGERMGPISRVASGGELSRVYLAIQLAARQGSSASGGTLVFDEVDAGIGGREAAALGHKLGRLARQGQILAVTHLPQVASFAKRHFRIRKRVSGGRTLMKIHQLDEVGRIDEIARMLAGREVTDLSRSHAEELIAVAAKK
ncbi:MAG: DNA repair protein RecN [Acidobacteriota bacterium]|nr:DNA repair protein RecN [Acidobacteriota bacterium]